MAEPKSREQLEKEWWDAWWAADYSWAGLAKHKIGGEGGLHGEKTLQDYWRRDPETGAMRDDAAMRAVGELVGIDGTDFHIVHLPPQLKGGGATWKADVESNEWSRFRAVLSARLGPAKETKIGLRLRATGQDGRAQFQGMVARNADFLERADGLLLYINCEASVFLGVVQFGKAAFGAGAQFDGVMFCNAANFGRAEFLGAASFRASKYCSSADFQQATFAGDVFFEHVHFVDFASFSNAKVAGSAAFDNVSFGGEASFSGVRLSGYTTFGEVVFSKNAEFDFAVFSETGGFVDFARSDFRERAHFMNAIFAGDADFASAAFMGEARFGSAVFRQSAHFSHASYSEDAYYNEVSISGFGDFGNCSFDGIAHFSAGKGEGSGQLSFQRARFSGATLFRNFLFGGLVHFDDATFSGDVDFTAAVFDKLASFERILWPDDARHWHSAFDQTLFRGTLALSGAGFMSFAAFDGATLERGIQIDDASEAASKQQFQMEKAAAIAAARADGADFEASEKEKRKEKGERVSRAEVDRHVRMKREERLKQLERGCRVLKQAMERASNKSREQLLYRFELQARRAQRGLPPGEALFSDLYGATSDYGASMVRPFVTLGLLIAAFTVLFFGTGTLLGLVGDGEAQVGGLAAWLQAFDLSWANVFKPLSALTAEGTPAGSLGEKLLSHSPLIGSLLRVAATLQSLLAIVLAFLFALAVRRRFQIS